jgi:lysophospholipase
MRELARVLVLYTGGTIGMKEGERGFVPAPGHLASLLERLPQFHDASQPREADTLPAFVMPPSRFGRRVGYAIKEYAPLLDSSNMGMEDWARIAEDVASHYDDHDAFVVLHGTDTMAYTASALSFMLEELGKTVVLTGSQIPLGVARNDAIDNLLGALTIAGHYEIPEVCLYFRNKLLRGNRAQKQDAAGLDAFQSGNFPPLVEVGIDIKVQWDALLRPSGAPFRVHTTMNRNVAALRLFPGITAETLANFLRPPLEGVVLETYGSGNAPDRRRDFLEVLREATARGVVIVNCTQCHKGSVGTTYAAGAALAEVGVVGGADLTPEAALTKLSYLLGKGLARDEVRRRMQVALRGELTAESAVRFSFREKAFVQSVAKVLRESHRRLDDDADAHIERALTPVLLCSAAALGDIGALRKLVEDGADVNAGDYDGRTALHLVASEGHLEAARFLLEAGANANTVDRWGGTPLADATRHKHDAVAALLVERGAELRRGDIAVALCAVAGAGDLAEVRRLIESGADVNAGDYDGRTALHLAASEGRLEVVRLLVERGARIDARDRWGGTPLTDALRHGHKDVAHLLFARGAS